MFLVRTLNINEIQLIKWICHAALEVILLVFDEFKKSLRRYAKALKLFCHTLFRGSIFA